MNFVFRNWLVRVGMGAMLIAACRADGALAQERKSESTTITPYTGKPILLDETEQVAKPTLVKHDKAEEKFADGKIRVERELAVYSDNSFEPDGVYREYYPNGKLFLEGKYEKGRRQGEWTYYFDNGTVNRKANHVDGHPDGSWEVFRADGTLAAKRGFKAGKRHGDWIIYDKAGKQPLREEHYADGKFDGVWKIYFPNGKLKQQIGFKEGARDGMSAEWDEKGEKRAEATYANNKITGKASRWLADGRTIVQEYQDGKLISQSTK